MVLSGFGNCPVGHASHVPLLSNSPDGQIHASPAVFGALPPEHASHVPLLSMCPVRQTHALLSLFGMRGNGHAVQFPPSLISVEAQLSQPSLSGLGVVPGIQTSHDVWSAFVMALSSPGHASQASPELAATSPGSHVVHRGNGPMPLPLPAGQKTQWSLPTSSGVADSNWSGTIFAGQFTHMVRSLDTAMLILDVEPPRLGS